MSNIFRAAAATILALHGLIHLIGPTVYLKLMELDGFAYKTTLLGGRWDLGERGIQAFGALWVFPAIGFLAAAAGLMLGYGWWGWVLAASTVLSLVLTALDYRVAFAGIVINVVILLLLLIRTANA
jgi:hypothetical protein